MYSTKENVYEERSQQIADVVMFLLFFITAAIFIFLGRHLQRVYDSPVTEGYVSSVSYSNSHSSKGSSDYTAWVDFEVDGRPYRGYFSENSYEGCMYYFHYDIYELEHFNYVHLYHTYYPFAKNIVILYAFGIIFAFFGTVVAFGKPAAYPYKYER